MFSSKKNSSRIGRGLLWCCLLLLVSVVGTTAEEELSQTEYEGRENDEEIEKLAVLTTRPPVSEGGTGGWEDTTRLPDSEATTLAAPCEELPLPPENGYITKGDNSGPGSGGLVRVWCEEGYSLSGPSTLFCLPVSHLPGGPVVWVPKKEYFCLPSANIDELQASTSNSIFDGEVFDGREQPYTEDIQLGETERQLSFEDIRCPQPTAPTNGEVIGTDYSMGASVTYACDAGYEMSGPNEARCLAVPDPFHHRAIWDPPTPPSCQPVNPAPPPPSVLLSPPDVEDTEGPGFKPRQRPVSAGRLTDTRPNPNEVEGLPSVCSLPPVTGPCRMAIPRFFFDTTTLECRPFTYGGCDGNENNFETFEACQAACR